MNKQDQGFIVRCTSSSQVIDVILDDYNILSPSISLLSLIDRASTHKFFSFLNEANNQGGTIGWEVNFNFDDQIRGYFLAGIREASGEIIITGSTLDSSMRKIYTDMMRINNEQTNSLRALHKSAVQGEAVRQQDMSSMDELTKINNEMANLHRELSKKNAELAWANERLEELNKEKNRFLGIAAHDLRNPLSVVLNYASQLYKGEGDLAGDSPKSMLQDIKKSSLLMLSVVNDFLDINKIESGQLHIEQSEVDVMTIIRDSVNANRHAANAKGITLDLEVSPATLTISADKYKLMQIFNNYISNAIKYSHRDTTTTITATVDGNNVRITVTDQGQGIPNTELDQLFKPYGLTSVKPTSNEKSTGLGLSIVAKIIEAHDGTYGAESEVGTGSTFWLTLPIGSNESGTAIDPETNKEVTEKSLEGKRIMIVDDDTILQRIVQRSLQPTNADIVLASDGSEAVELVHTGPPFDLILMDLNMPGMNGLEATRKIRETASADELPIVILSGASDAASQAEMLEAGANKTLVKPIVAEDIIREVTEILHP